MEVWGVLSWFQTTQYLCLLQLSLCQRRCVSLGNYRVTNVCRDLAERHDKGKETSHAGDVSGGHATTAGRLCLGKEEWGKEPPQPT